MRHQRKRSYAPSDNRQLLYSRAQAAKLLGCSVRQIERLEKDYRKLTPVRLTPSATAAVYYRHAELMALAEQGD